MPFTDFPYGASSFGIPLANVGRAVETGKHWWVNSVTGNDTHQGIVPTQAKATIAAMVAKVGAGDTIHLIGSFNEAVVLTSLAGVTFLGEGTRAHRANWTGPTDAVCLTLAGSSDCIIENIRFQPPARSAGTPAAISMTGASAYAKIYRCQFQGKTGSWYGILTDGAQDHVQILENEFIYLNTLTYGTAIKGQTYTGNIEPTDWLIAGNRFHSNLNHVVCRLNASYVLRNYFTAGGLQAAGTGSATMTLLGLDIHSGQLGYNVVTQNYLGSLYQHSCYYGGTGDDWAGNYCTDRTHGTQVDAATGLSILPPA